MARGVLALGVLVLLALLGLDEASGECLGQRGGSCRG